MIFSTHYQGRNFSDEHRPLSLWYKPFNRGRSSLADERRKSCTESVVVSENIDPEAT